MEPDDTSSAALPAGGAGTGQDAPRRTWLAAERTYLAWLRTGLGALGLALAVGRLIPALVDVSHVEFGLLGEQYVLVGGAATRAWKESSCGGLQAGSHSRINRRLIPSRARPGAWW